MKQIIAFPFYTWLLFAGLIMISSCEVSNSRDYLQIKGETMGTYYAVTYYDSKGRNFKEEVDSLLVQINEGVSTYIPGSTISQFNQAMDSIDFTGANNPMVNQHFLENYAIAWGIYERTDGAFDPTVMPLVNYWGFGYTGKKPITGVDSLMVDSLKQLVGFNKIKKTGLKFKKLIPGMQLDLSACAKGYGVDQLSYLLEKNQIKDYLVDIGGEIKVRGKNKKGQDWTIGINVPRENAAYDEIQEAIPVTDVAVATSGNYRNFYEVDGVKYSHTINPFTGFPERNTLLSASVFTTNCAVADAYATAFMVMGLDRALMRASQAENLEAYFIYSNSKGEMEVAYTDGLEAKLKKQ